MNKPFRRSPFVLLVIAALVLLVGAPAGAFAAGDKSRGVSAPGGAAVEPSGSSAQPVAPDSTEWSPQGSDEEASGGGPAPPLQHGSSVGSGVVPSKAEPKSEAPSYSPESSGSYEPDPSTSSQTSSPSPSPSTFEEPVSTPRAGGGGQSKQPTAATTASKTSRAVDVGVGAADAVAHSAPPQGGGIDSAPTATAASLADPGDGGSTSSYALPLLLVTLVLGAILRYAYVRLRRHRLRQQREALWREQDAVWEAALRRAELGQVAGDSELSPQPWRQINTA